jgi:hypothetical protein
MEDEIKQHRILAVQRFRNGESPGSICTSRQVEGLAVQVGQAT